MLLQDEDPVPCEIDARARSRLITKWRLISADDYLGGGSNDSDGEEDLSEVYIVTVPSLDRRIPRGALMYRSSLFDF